MSNLPPADIPLPTSDPGSQSVTASLIPGSVSANSNIAPAMPAYDAATLAYYQAYYAQYGVAYGAQAYAAAAAYPQVQPVTSPYLNLVGHNVTNSGYVDSNPRINQEPMAGSSKDHLGGDEEDDDDPTIDRNYTQVQKTGSSSGGQPLPIHGNVKTMNLNPLLLTNIQQSTYFKVTLYKLKTINELIDEIWYNVKHLEPWERGSRKVGGQTGMCGSVRGVGSGGIASSAFCILYKIFTLKPTRKQINSLIKSKDSSYIRAIGLLYVRYTQAPDTLWDWFEKYLLDEEEVNASAGGMHSITIGDIVRNMLTKLEWFQTLFPRIPVPVQKDIDAKLSQFDQDNKKSSHSIPKSVSSSSRYESCNDPKRDYDRRSDKDQRSDRDRKSDSRGRSRSRSRSRDKRRRDRSSSGERRRHHRHRSRSSESKSTYHRHR